jgi:hypothetical protein
VKDASEKESEAIRSEENSATSTGQASYEENRED